MGLDLTLLPFNNSSNEEWAESNTLLPCLRFHELFDLIKELGAREVPEHFGSYMGRISSCEEHHYGETHEDAYGEPMKRVRVRQLLTLSEHELVREIPVNRAIWAYLAQLPSRTWVGLYWC